MLRVAASSSAIRMRLDWTRRFVSVARCWRSAGAIILFVLLPSSSQARCPVGPSTHPRDPERHSQYAIDALPSGRDSAGGTLRRSNSVVGGILESPVGRADATPHARR